MKVALLPVIFGVLVTILVSGCVQQDGLDPETNQEAACTPSWQCADWGECAGTWLSASQTRVCTDAGDCGVVAGKPEETRACQLPRVASKEPSELALQLSDLPEGFEIGERTEKTESDVSQDAKDKGWEKGYYVRFVKLGENLLQVTTIEHSNSIYPAENVSKVLESNWWNGTNTVVEDLSDPKIGDKSKAYRITAEGELVTNTGYVIEFVKLDVYTMIVISGTVGIDYELLKELASKAEQKIS